MSTCHLVSFRPIVWLMGLCLCAPAFSGQSESSNYVLQQSTVNTAGAVSDSGAYRLTGSVGQEATIGTSSSSSHVLQSGFWSFVRSGLVPVILFVDKNGVTSGNVDLSWSGNNSPYDIYESADCANVFLTFLDSAVANAYADVMPPATDLVCYSVLATAPGPAPPANLP